VWLTSLLLEALRVASTWFTDSRPPERGKRASPQSGQ